LGVGARQRRARRLWWAHVPERVLAAGSLSKIAWGGPRVGWLRAPRPVILRLARVKGALNLGVGALDQLAAVALLDDYERLRVGPEQPR
jgi:DNA-binding transcriptional MocR family regulator